MKYDSSVDATDNLGDYERADFQFAVNGKAFKVMLDDLYSNKIRGVLRELSSNALDAQIEAGVTSPFTIHLPTPLYPEFRIRDYGTGLCHEDVMGLYVTLFDSTKDDSNEATGTFGLGSKIPFAYTDAFTVTSYFHGEVRTYSCNIGDQGVPGITYLSDLTAPTDEPNGLEVTVAVSPEDCGEFSRELSHLQLAFDPKPDVIGGEYDPIVPTWQGLDGRVQMISSDYYGESLCVKQGSAIYPVSDFRVKQEISSFVSYRSSLVLEVPIGTVAIAPNREALSMNNDTREALRGEVSAAVEKIAEEALEAILSAPNRLEATRIFEEHPRGLLKPQLLTKLSDGGWTPDGVVVLHGGSDWDVPEARMGNSRGTSKLDGFRYPAIKNLLFVVSDSSRPVKREMLRYRDFVKEIEETSREEVYLLKDPTPRQLERLYTLLGLEGHQIISIGALDDPGPPVRKPKDSSKVSGVRPHSVRPYTLAEVEELPEKYYWYELSNYNNARMRRDCGFVVTDSIHHGFMDDDIPVLTFTRTAVKKLQPPADMEIHKVRERGVASLHDKIVAHLLRGHLTSRFAEERIWKELGVEVPPLPDNPPATHFRTPDMEMEAADKAAEIIRPLKQKYPLLFGDRTFEAVSCYIDMSDNATEGTSQS